jgi:hypothetical protein
MTWGEAIFFKSFIYMTCGVASSLPRKKLSNLGNGVNTALTLYSRDRYVQMAREEF